MAKRVLFYVQHLLGIGHLHRAALISRNLSRAGLDVILVSGGEPLPHLDLGSSRFVQLSPVRTIDQNFTTLVDMNNQPVDDSWRRSRCNHLLDVWKNHKPDVVILELFPFGRRQMQFELLPLLDAVKSSGHRTIVVSSVRDILSGSRTPTRNNETVEFIKSYFDYVLIHSDPKLITFNETFVHADKIASQLVYTGYTVDPAQAIAKKYHHAQGEVIVSAGSGAVGLSLLETAILTRKSTVLKNNLWRVLVGIRVSESSFQALQKSSDDNLIIERARTDFPKLLNHCALSISQGGYNTTCEALVAKTRCVIVPFSQGTETEQTIRTTRLAKRGFVKMIPESNLNPKSLSSAIRDAMDTAPTCASSLNTSGVATTVSLVQDWAERASK